MQDTPNANNTGNPSHSLIRDKTPALLAARAGVWDYNIKRDRLSYCLAAARAFGLPSEERWSGLPLERLSEVIHPQDREYYLSEVAPVLRHGGAVNATLRTRPDAGSSRRLLVRGDVVSGERDEDVHASGIVVDLTEEDTTEPYSNDKSQSPSAVPPDLIAGIDHLIAARAHLVALNELETGGVISILDMLLMNLGRALARKLDAGDVE